MDVQDAVSVWTFSTPSLLLLCLSHSLGYQRAGWAGCIPRMCVSVWFSHFQSWEAQCGSHAWAQLPDSTIAYQSDARTRGSSRSLCLLGACRSCLAPLFQVYCWYSRCSSLPAWTFQYKMRETIDLFVVAFTTTTSSPGYTQSLQRC